MKGFKIFVSCLLCSNLGAQIPNNSFSSWTDSGSYSIPDFWDNLNEYTSSGGVYTCIEGDPGNPGTNFLILVTENVPGKGVVAGKAVSGKIDTTTFKPTSGFPYISRPAQLNYIIQYMPWDFSDPSNIYVCLTKWDSLNNQRDTIATGYSEFLGMAHSWFATYTDLIYQSGDMPDTACIVISSSSVNPLAGGYLYIDDLNFSGSVIGINEMKEPINYSIFPNPADVFINIKSKTSDEWKILEVFDSSGKLVHSDSFPSEYILDIEQWNAGIYFFRLIQGNFVHTEKISIR